MVNHCCVRGCFSKNRGRSIEKSTEQERRGTDRKESFFRVPSVIKISTKDLIELSMKRRKCWLQAMKNKERIHANARVCSKHFISGKHASLEDVNSPDWVPSLNMGHATVPSQSVHSQQLPISEESQLQPLFECALCNRCFTRKDNLKYHLKCQHDIKEEPKRRLQCPECDCKVVKYDLLRQHMVDDHKKVLICNIMDFKSVTEFQTWKCTEEMNTNSYFVKMRGSKVLTNCKKTYYVCNRSGDFVPQGKGLRKTRAVGSLKIGKTCPASMTLIEVASNVKVLYFPEHFGHSLTDLQDIKTLKLSQLEKMTLAEKLKNGMSFNDILKEVKGSFESKKKVTRLDFLTLKDLHNIVRELKSEAKKEDTRFRLKEHITMKLQFALKCIEETGHLSYKDAIQLQKPVDELLNQIVELKKANHISLNWNEISTSEEVIGVASVMEIQGDSDPGLIATITESPRHQVLHEEQEGRNCEKNSSVVVDMDVKSESSLLVKPVKGKKSKTLVVLSNTWTGEQAFVRKVNT